MAALLPAVHADFISRLPSNLLPDSYEDVALTLQSHVVSTARRQGFGDKGFGVWGLRGLGLEGVGFRVERFRVEAEIARDPSESPHPIIGGLPCSGSTLRAPYAMSGTDLSCAATR
eukprot:1453772-Rhodomonas_salina.2